MPNDYTTLIARYTVERKFVTLEEVVQLAKQLAPRDKVCLVAQLASLIESDLLAAQSHVRKSLFGLCSDLGPAPSAEEIEEARRQEWTGFPREEI